MRELAGWEWLLGGALLLFLLWRWLPGLGRADLREEGRPPADWMGLLVPVLLTAVFVVVLIMLVR